MFTGIIEQTGTLLSISSGEGARISIRHLPWPEPLVLGESVAVQGVCLTVASIGNCTFECDLLDETRRATSLADASPGCELNLERALRANGRFGGHFVSGHVDGTALVESIQRVGRDWSIRMRHQRAEWHTGILTKGSVAVDGVSLTVVETGGDWFAVHCIPHTWAHTTLSSLHGGKRVNIETDMLGKYVRHFVGGAAPSTEHLSLATLISAGY